VFLALLKGTGIGLDCQVTVSKILVSNFRRDVEVWIDSWRKKSLPHRIKQDSLTPRSSKMNFQAIG